MLRAFGTTFRGDVGTFEPIASWFAGDDGEVTLTPAAVADVAGMWSGPASPERVAHRVVDGRHVRFERGAAEDLLIQWERCGELLIDTKATTLYCAPLDGIDEAAWLRFVLDTGLSAVGLAHGAEALHAGAVSLPGGRGAIAVIAGQGGGKTSLLAEMLQRGASLICDDIAVITPDMEVEPGPPVMNVAIDRPFPPSPSELGTPLALIDDEVWVAVPGASTPVGLRALVLLERRFGAALDAEVVPGSPIALLGHTLNSGADHDRQQQRFDRIGDLAERVPTVRLTASPDVPPTTLADVIDGALRDTPEVR